MRKNGSKLKAINANENRLMKITKSQKVFSISSLLHKNGGNYCLENIPIEKADDFGNWL